MVTLFLPQRCSSACLWHGCAASLYIASGGDRMHANHAASKIAWSAKAPESSTASRQR